MTNTKLTTVLTEAVKEVIEEKSDIIINEELKEEIWKVIYAQINKEIY